MNIQKRERPPLPPLLSPLPKGGRGKQHHRTGERRKHRGTPPPARGEGKRSALQKDVRGKQPCKGCEGRGHHRKVEGYVSHSFRVVVRSSPRYIPPSSFWVVVLSHLPPLGGAVFLLYTDTHFHAHFLCVIACRHIMTHCAHSHCCNGSRSDKNHSIKSPHGSATETASTTWTSCDQSSLHSFAW